MISISHGQLISVNKDVWFQFFAQASFSFIIDNSLQKDRPFSVLLPNIEKKLIDCFLISILNLDPMLKNQSILQILRKKKAKVQTILDKYSMAQIMDIFAETSQFKDCFWINGSIYRTPSLSPFNPTYYAQPLL